MITKQLRLGNWIQGVRTFKDGKKTYDPPMQVVTLTEGYLYADIDGNEGDPFEYVFDEVEGIPLTGDILLQCGFEERGKNSKGDSMYRLTINKEKRIDLDGIMHTDGFAVHLFSIGNPLMYVETIHDLQNLYFSLCGQELQTPTVWL